MEDKKTKVEEYCKRVDQIIREMDEDRPLEEIQIMIEKLNDCKKNLDELKRKYEEEAKSLFEKNGGGTDSFEALATENMLKKINGVLEEISTFVELAQAFIAENSKEKTEMVEETVSKNLPEEDEMPEIDVIKVVPIEPINWEEIQPKTSLDDLPQFFDKDRAEEIETEPVKGGPFKLGEEILEVEDDLVYSGEEVQEEEIDLASEVKEELEEPEREEEEKLPEKQVIKINLDQPIEEDYLKMAKEIIKARGDMKDPAEVAESGSSDSRKVFMTIKRVLIPQKIASKSKDYERERGDE